MSHAKNVKEAAKILPLESEQKFSKNDYRYWLSRVYLPAYSKGGETKESGTYSVRIQAHGERRGVSLEKTKKREAAQEALQLYELVRAHGWEAGLKDFRKEKPVMRSRLNLGEYLREVAAAGLIRPSTLRTYKAKIRRIAGDIAQIKLPNGLSKHDYRHGGTDTWFPLAHQALLEEVQTQLETAGFTIGRESHALSHGGYRYFGVMEVMQPGQPDKDYAWVVGLRNSHDKTFPAGLVAGTSVFTCDNLAFSGEVKINRKHTRFAYRDLRNLTARAVGKLGVRFRSLDKRIDAYRDCPVADWAAHDLVIRAIDCRAITPSQVPQVVDEWRNPSHREFRPRNLWSLFNAFTEAYKGQNPSLTLNRSEALHGLCDGVVGLAN